MLSPLFKTFLISMTPIGELRAGIPYGLLKGLDPILVFVVAVAGNMVPVVFLLWLLPYVEKWLERKGTEPFAKGSVPFLSRAYLWYCQRTQRKYSKRFQKLGALALITFVAIPLPITGAWTGTLAAYIFHVPPKKACALIFVGVMIAGVIVTWVSLGIL